MLKKEKAARMEMQKAFDAASRGNIELAETALDDRLKKATTKISAKVTREKNKKSGSKKSPKKKPAKKKPAKKKPARKKPPRKRTLEDFDGTDDDSSVPLVLDDSSTDMGLLEEAMEEEEEETLDTFEDATLKKILLFEKRDDDIYMRCLWTDGEKRDDALAGLYIDFPDQVVAYSRGRPSIRAMLAKYDLEAERNRQADCAGGNPEVLNDEAPDEEQSTVSDNPVPGVIPVAEATVVQEDTGGGDENSSGEWEVDLARLPDGCKHDVYEEGTQYMQETIAGYCKEGNNMFGVSCAHCAAKFVASGKSVPKVTFRATTTRPIYCCERREKRNCKHALCNGCFKKKQSEFLSKTK